ncbi:protein phosphatase CheZ [Thermodesulfovibrionales bacterium]|nr:protein phosphatase CheZ [Thermodesulfovibrionales bacterium]
MQYIGFTIGGSEYTVPILRIQEIVNLPRLTKLPLAPYYVEGITNLRGRIMPVINLRKIVGMDNGSAGKQVIVVTSGRIIFGVLVDSITGVITIDESEIEPPTDLNASEIIEGVAMPNDKLVMLLDTKKLIPAEDMSIFEDEILSIEESGDKVEVTKKIEGKCGETVIKETMDAKSFFEKKIDAQDPRYAIFNDMIKFMEAISKQDYEEADTAIHAIMQKGQGDLFKEVGRVTRKLHNSIRNFRDAVDPKLKDMAIADIPNAADKLNHVIDKTEEAAHKTMSIVERSILEMDEVASHIRNIEGPEDSREYLKGFKDRLEDDLTEILMTQSFQDLTGQIIKKVIKLIEDVEKELVNLVATFGVKIEEGKIVKVFETEKVSQSDVDDLLKDLGF